MDQTRTGKVDFDTLLGRVVANMPETWIVFARTRSSSHQRSARRIFCTTKGRPPKRAPLHCENGEELAARCANSCFFFSEHLLLEASHMPPAFSQSAALVAFVTSPAKAGPVKASAKANTNIETRGS